MSMSDLCFLPGGKITKAETGTKPVLVNQKGSGGKDFSEGKKSGGRRGKFWKQVDKQGQLEEKDQEGEQGQTFNGEELRGESGGKFKFDLKKNSHTMQRYSKGRKSLGNSLEDILWRASCLEGKTGLSNASPKKEGEDVENGTSGG